MVMPRIIQSFAERRAVLQGSDIATAAAEAETDETVTEPGNGGAEEGAQPAAEPAADDATAGEDTQAGDDGSEADAAPADDAAADEGGGKGGGPEETAASPADVVRVCNEAGFPEMAESLIREGVSASIVLARVNLATAITEQVAMARKIQPAIDPALAADFIAAGASLEHVRGQLFEKLANMAGPETVNVRGSAIDTGGGDGPSKAALNPAAIYAARKEARETWPLNQ